MDGQWCIRERVKSGSALDKSSFLYLSQIQGEKIAFIMDESNVLDSSFLERMNTLLANGEVPGLFEGDEYTTLMTQCKEGSTREGSMLDSSEELYKWFTQQVCSHYIPKNLVCRVYRSYCVGQLVSLVVYVFFWQHYFSISN